MGYFQINQAKKKQILSCSLFQDPSWNLIETYDLTFYIISHVIFVINGFTFSQYWVASRWIADKTLLCKDVFDLCDFFIVLRFICLPKRFNRRYSISKFWKLFKSKAPCQQLVMQHLHQTVFFQISHFSLQEKQAWYFWDQLQLCQMAWCVSCPYLVPESYEGLKSMITTPNLPPQRHPSHTSWQHQRHLQARQTWTWYDWLVSQFPHFGKFVFRW